MKKKMLILEILFLMIIIVACGSAENTPISSVVEDNSKEIIEITQPEESPEPHIPRDDEITLFSYYLEEKVRSFLRKPEAPLTKEDILKITELAVTTNEIDTLSDLNLFENLKILSVASGTIENIEGIESLTNLESLRIGAPGLNDIAPLSPLVNLEVLAFVNGSIKDYTAIGNLKNLTRLQIFGENKNIESLDFLKNNSKLKYLEITDGNISDISALSNLKYLEDLNLKNNKISDITSLKELNRLDYLVLSDNLIEDISCLNYFEDITGVSIENNPLKEGQYIKYLETKYDLYSVQFKEKINESLPEFTFEIFGGKTKETYPNYSSMKLSIWQGGEFLQEFIFEKDEFVGFPTSYDENFGFVIEDMNFDGYEDIRLIFYVPASPNISYTCWLWDKDEGLYVENPDFRIFDPVFDHENQLVYSYARGSATDHYENVYQYIDGKLTKIKKIETGYVNPNDTENTYLMEYHLIDGQWQLVNEEIIELR